MPTINLTKINPLINLITYSIIEGNETLKQAADYSISCALSDNTTIQPLTVFDLKTIQTELGNWLILESSEEDNAELEHPEIFAQFEYIDTLLTGTATINDINEFLAYLNESIAL